mmetsp:Transcript_6707/g.25277  ORF Transcript_6707/g.25277 Transcript_6707/m.25277 type:complete len:411 (-) Transcript_6707:475-1707(-)
MPLPNKSRKKHARAARTSLCAWNSTTAAPGSFSVSVVSSSSDLQVATEILLCDTITVVGMPLVLAHACASETSAQRTTSTTSVKVSSTTSLRLSFLERRFLSFVSFFAASREANRSRVCMISRSSPSSPGPDDSSSSTLTVTTNCSDPDVLSLGSYPPRVTPSVAAMSAVAPFVVVAFRNSNTRRACSSFWRSFGHAAASIAACAFTGPTHVASKSASWNAAVTWTRGFSATPFSFPTPTLRRNTKTSARSQRFVRDSSSLVAVTAAIFAAGATLRNPAFPLICIWPDGVVRAASDTASTKGASTSTSHETGGGCNSMLRNRVQSSHVLKPTQVRFRIGFGSFQRCTRFGRTPCPPMPTEINPSSVQVTQYRANFSSAPGTMNAPRCVCATQPLRSMHKRELRCEPMMMT